MDGPGLEGRAGCFGGAGGCGGGVGLTPNWPALLASWTGTTVTIFTSSGGQSGAGFTGVLISVNDVFVRLITRIGPPPGCSLGNACTGFNVGMGEYSRGFCGGGAGGFGGGPAGVSGAASAGGWDAVPVWTVGSVTDIPIASIVSFVHNAI